MLIKVGCRGHFLPASPAGQRCSTLQDMEVTGILIVYTQVYPLTVRVFVPAFAQLLS
jgi:hypothetical protein